MRNKQDGFEKCLANCNTVTNDVLRTNEEVRNAFYSLKTYESVCYDDISFNAINVNKSEYIASSGQRHNMALNNFFLHLLNHVLKIFNWGVYSFYQLRYRLSNRNKFSILTRLNLDNKSKQRIFWGWKVQTEN